MVKRGDNIYDGWEMYYLHLKNKKIIRAENIFTSKREFIDKGLPLIINATKKELIEVGLIEEIPIFKGEI
jgi:hypothetical protein